MQHPTQGRLLERARARRAPQPRLALLALSAACATPAAAPPTARPAPLAPASTGAPAASTRPEPRPAAPGLAQGWVTPGQAGGFAPFDAPPPPRREGGNRLIVDDPPQIAAPPRGLRLRVQTQGSLSAGSERRWVGPRVPGYVPLEAGTQELFLLDPAGDGALLALYRDPYGASTCTLGDPRNCGFTAVLFGKKGEVVWDRGLNQHMSRPDHLELQDLRLDGGVLYFNEACGSYSKEAGGQCSSLVALDPAANRVLWRSAPLRSNNVFAVVNGRYLLTGYGFTGEPRHLFLLRRSDGATVSKAPLPSNHHAIERLGGASFRVEAGDSVVVITVQGADTEAASLSAVALRK